MRALTVFERSLSLRASLALLLALSDKRVFLFYTFEGGVSESALRRWRDRVKTRGGVVVAVAGINRKRLSPAALAERGRELARTIRARAH